MRAARVATCWLGGCSGCHMSLLNLHQELLVLLEQCQLVYSPLMDIKEYPWDVDVVLVEGALNNDDNREMALTVRERSRFVVSLGECACYGNVTALRNPHDPDEILAGQYGREFSPPVGGRLSPQALPLHRVIRVDRHIPGCPPEPAAIRTTLEELLDHL